jgi:hypothetical protein
LSFSRVSFAGKMKTAPPPFLLANGVSADVGNSLLLRFLNDCLKALCAGKQMEIAEN